MSTRLSLIKGSLLAVTAALALGTGNAWAQHAGGGGFHGGGGHAAVGGGFHGGGAVHGGYGYRGGYYGGYRGYGYGYRGGWGGYYGWRGGWGWGWGWGCCGVGLGWYLPILPLGYATYYWGGIPYYYADSNYYVWDSAANSYQAVDPPTGLTTTPSASAAAAPGPGSAPSSYGPSTWTDLFAYPKGGQSVEQQTRDRDECHTWAVSQTGFDPAKPNGNGDPRDAAAKREGYLRAEGACLEARNYSVK